MVKKYYKNLPIRRQLLLSFLGMTILPLIVTCTLCFALSAKIIGQKARQYTYENVCQLSDNIDNYLSQIELTSLSIAYNPNIQDFLNSTHGGKSYSRSQLYQLEKSMILTYNYSTMRDISIITAKGDILSVPHSISNQYKFVNGLSVEPHTALWYNDPYQNLIQMVRHVESTQTYQSIGTLCISLYNGFLHDLSGNLAFGPDGGLAVLDKENKPVSPFFADNSFLSDCTVLFNRESGDFTHRVNGKTYHYFYRISPKTGWKTIGIISLNELFRQIISLGTAVAVCVLLVTLAAVFMSRRLSSLFSGKIQTVLQAMKLASNGNFSIQLPAEESTNEFAMLNSGFNSMIAEINTLIETVYKAQILQKESEFKALQAEINPHFLYNTLDTICWQAKLSGNEDIFQTSFSLAALLRASVGSKKLYVTLEEELSYVNDYIQIQKVRYRDKITAEISIPEKLLASQVPKLILQPIVENAFIHGLEPKRGNGFLMITGEIFNEDIIVKVRDNGVGMTREQISVILNRDPDSSVQSIGLINVHKRLNLLYGEAYGIQIRSVLEEGTTVTLKLPLKTE